MPRRIQNVWAVACPTCHAQADQPCRDMRNVCRQLFGRRTHKERARAVREWAANGQPVLRRDREVRVASYQPTLFTTAYQDRVWDTWNNLTTTTAAAIQTYVQSTTITGNGVANVVWDDHEREGVWVQWQTTGQVTFTPNEELYRQWVEADDARDRRRAEEEERRLRRQQEYHDRVQALREQENAARLRREQRERVAAEAQETALELFRSLLTAEQAQEWAERQQVTVRGSAGGIYVLDGTMDSIHGNVVQIDEHGCNLRRLCFATRMYEDDYNYASVLPLADGWVGQLMAIRHNEDEVVRIANPSQIRRCQRVTGANRLRGYAA